MLIQQNRAPTAFGGLRVEESSTLVPGHRHAGMFDRRGGGSIPRLAAHGNCEDDLCKLQAGPRPVCSHIGWGSVAEFTPRCKVHGMES